MIFITGSTGFVGRHLLRALKDRKLKVRCLVRSEQKIDTVRDLVDEIVVGDLRDRDVLKGSLEGISTVVHLVGIIMETHKATFKQIHVEATRTLVEEARQQGVKRFFYQSALGASVDSPFAYSRTKAEAEEIVKNSALQYVIFRPSLILGRGDGFTENIKKLLRLGPIVPLPAGGRARYQPIHISDWIKCFMKVFEDDGLWGRIYEFGGPEHLTYREILQCFIKQMGLRRIFVDVPISLVKIMLPFAVLPRAVGIPVPVVSQEQLSMLAVDNITDRDAVKKHFGFTPQRLQDYIGELVQ